MPPPTRTVISRDVIPESIAATDTDCTRVRSQFMGVVQLRC